MSYSLSHLKQYLAFKRCKNIVGGEIHAKRHACAHCVDEDIKIRHLGIKEKVALAHDDPKLFAAFESQFSLNRK